jgi:hypothetical protein
VTCRLKTETMSTRAMKHDSSLSTNEQACHQMNRPALWPQPFFRRGPHKHLLRNSRASKTSAPLTRMIRTLALRRLPGAVLQLPEALLQLQQCPWKGTQGLGKPVAQVELPRSSRGDDEHCNPLRGQDTLLFTIGRARPDALFSGWPWGLQSE